MANNWTNSDGWYVQGTKVVGTQGTNIPELVITWTANEPTAASTQTIADGDSPTVAETGQAIANLNAKIDAIIAALEAHGLTA